jgi:germination protein M
MGATMKRWVILLSLLILSGLLGGCSKRNGNDNSESPVVQIYYINSKTSALVNEKYKLISKEQKEQIDELLYMLKRNPDNLLYKSALAENVSVKEVYFNKDGSLSIDFNSGYSKLKGIPEVLCRAAIVKTLSQIDGVEFIQFTENGQSLIDSNNKPIGLMTNDDFIDSTGTETKIKLYFANEEGDALVEYVKNITYTGNGSLEELVLQELINGPEQIGMERSIPEGTKLLKVEMKEGICYVDFNEKFLDKQPELPDNIIIYSIVNTLVQLPYIDKVQFLINGEVTKTFGDGTAFDAIFERNLSLLE